MLTDWYYNIVCQFVRRSLYGYDFSGIQLVQKFRPIIYCIKHGQVVGGDHLLIAF